MGKESPCCVLEKLLLALSWRMFFMEQHSGIPGNPSLHASCHAQSCLTLQPHGLLPAKILLSFGFVRQEYWSGLPIPPPGDLPSPGIQHVFPMSPVLQVDALRLSHHGSPHTSL